MKKVIILTVFICGFFVQATAQTKYPKGCYMSLLEIKSKTPSVNFALEMVKRTNGDIVMNGGNDFKPVTADKSIKKKFLKREIWAISDGEKLYLNCFLHGCQPWYALVESEESNLIFSAGVSAATATTSAVMGGAIGGAAAATIRYRYSLDLTTGQLNRIDDK